TNVAGAWMHGSDLGYFIFGQAKKSFVHGCTYAAIAWMRRSSELAAKRRQIFRIDDLHDSMSP
ncbi:MAG: hypothetical protein KAI77_00055, partial [Gammaproteobacteria bacterium]|nr:hypothetical protein [Gammaproteobacteria bacterium]